MDGDVQLVGGQIDQEGRVEACVGGTWGPICGKGFDEGDAYVVCKELGHGTACKLIRDVAVIICFGHVL